MFSFFGLTKTPQEKLIDFLEKKGLKEKAESLRNGTTSLNLWNNKIGAEGARVLADALKTNSSITALDLGHNQIGDEGGRGLADALKTNSSITSLYLPGNHQIGDERVKEIGKYIQRNENLAEKKAETLNAQGDSFCGKGEYGKAIEKYNAAIKINKNDLYIANKEKAEKKYVEQQQTKEFEQLILAIKENKTEEAEKLVKQMDVHILNKVNNGGETALTLAASNGLEKVCELLISKMSVQAINQVNNYGETALTWIAFKGLVKVCEMLIPKMSDQTINHINKNGETALSLAQQNGFKNICNLLNLKTNESTSTITFIVNKIIYDNPLLNHPELLQPAMEKFSLKEIGERIDELSPSLINTAINSEDGELIILGGLMSLEYNEAPTG